MNQRYIMIMMMYYILISACLFRSPSWETNPNGRTKPNYDHMLKIVYKRCPWDLLGSVLVFNHWFFLQNKRTLKMSSNDPIEPFGPAFSVHWTFEKYKHGWIPCTSLSSLRFSLSLLIEASNDFLISEKSYKYFVLNFFFKYSLRIVLLKGSWFKYFVSNESKVYNDNDDVLHINQCLSLSKSKLVPIFAHHPWGPSIRETVDDEVHINQCPCFA